MTQLVAATVTGAAFGAAFALLKLPIPAPPTVAGVLGVAGVTVGYMLVTWWQA